jgi:glycosyltransferase involved in cell wall biosynthesis
MNSSRPTVSIIMSTFDRGMVLDRAIQSIVEQTFEDWELILVDDASGDEGRHIAQAWSKQHHKITTIRNPTNRGLAASLNRAIASSTGRYIARMDDDDASHPERLRMQVDFLERHPEIDVLGAAAFVVDSTGIDLGINSRPETHEEIVRTIYRSSPFIHPTVMMRRDFIQEAGGYDETFLRAEDRDLWLRSYRTHTFHNLQVPLLTYTAPRAPALLSLKHSSRAIMNAGRRDRRIGEASATCARLFIGGIWTHITRRTR